MLTVWSQPALYEQFFTSSISQRREQCLVNRADIREIPTHMIVTVMYVSLCAASSLTWIYGELSGLLLLFFCHKDVTSQVCNCT